MIGWIITIMACAGMAKIAGNEGRSGLLWGMITFLLCFGAAYIIPFPLVNVGIGLVISFIVYTAVKIIQER